MRVQECKKDCVETLMTEMERKKAINKSGKVDFFQYSCGVFFQQAQRALLLLVRAVGTTTVFSGKFTVMPLDFMKELLNSFRCFSDA